MRLAIFCVFLLLAEGSSAQFMRERSALNFMKKGKWDKAQETLYKSSSKDSINTVARYVLALYYFSPQNPAYHIDSAYAYVMGAMSDFAKADEKERGKARRFPLDSSYLVGLREKIDSAAFIHAKNLDTEASYAFFIGHHPYSPQQTEAHILKENAAFREVKKTNTYQAYWDFLITYPQGNWAQEAKYQYEKLLFEAHTKDKKLKSFVSFLSAFPKTPYRTQVEKEIFEISTALGNKETFMDFIHHYPTSPYSQKAKQILYALLLDEHLPIPKELTNDSIAQVQNLNAHFLVPFFHQGKFGFMNNQGQEIISPSTEEVDALYSCGNITDELLAVGNKIVARNGKVIFEGTLKELTSLEKGFYRIDTKDCALVIHQSGWVMPPACMEDVRFLAHRFLAIQKGKQWEIRSLTGKVVLPLEWDDVLSIQDVIGLRKNGKWFLTTVTDIGRKADQGELTLSEGYDQVKALGNYIQVEKGSERSILNLDLKVFIPFKKQDFQLHFFGIQSTSAEGIALWGFPSGPVHCEKVKILKPWVWAKMKSTWLPLDKYGKPFGTVGYDSAWFTNAYPMAIKSDTTTLFLDGEETLILPGLWKVKYISGDKSEGYFLAQLDKSKRVYSTQGMKLMEINYEDIEFMGQGLFVVSHHQKKGIVHKNGKMILPLEYDGIGQLKDGAISILKNGKFGLFDLGHHRLIKPIYQKNVIPYSTKHLVAFKDGYYGFITWDNKPVGKFEYDEIAYWNESVAMVKIQSQWKLMDIATQKAHQEKIKGFRYMVDSPDEKVVVFQDERGFGVMSNKRGIVIPPTFSDIVNIGPPDDPLYFTEKHVVEASLFVVIYYDKNGKLIRRQTFEVEEYEKIYCSQGK